MLSYALVSRQGKSFKKSSFTEQKKRKFFTADTAHLLNRTAVCVLLFNWLNICVFIKSACVCKWVLLKSMNGHHFSAFLNQRHLDQNTGSKQKSCLPVTAWTRPLHFPANCWNHWTPRWIRRRKTFQQEQIWEKINKEKYIFIMWSIFYTYPSAREISSSWVLCSGCPFSAGFILYCWTSWLTWFSCFVKQTKLTFSIFAYNIPFSKAWICSTSSSYHSHLTGSLANFSLHLVELHAELLTGNGCCTSTTCWPLGLLLLWGHCCLALAGLCISFSLQE